MLPDLDDTSLIDMRFPGGEVYHQELLRIAPGIRDDCPDMDICNSQEAKDIARVHWVAPARRVSSSRSACASFLRRSMSLPNPSASRTCSTGIQFRLFLGGLFRFHSGNSCVTSDSSSSSNHQ